jgi:hypothetical protein
MALLKKINTGVISCIFPKKYYIEVRSKSSFSGRYSSLGDDNFAKEIAIPNSSNIVSSDSITLVATAI